VSPQRIDYYGSPTHRRPTASSLPLPGGAIDLGECAITGLVAVYAYPWHIPLYTNNGEVRQEFSIVLTARAVSGCTRTIGGARKVPAHPAVVRPELGDGLRVPVERIAHVELLSC
jgi:hypothetical protein